MILGRHSTILLITWTKIVDWQVTTGNRRTHQMAVLDV
jgi:hypothetical protein